MKLPNKFTVGIRKYTVLLTNALPKALRGRITYDTKLIEVRPQQPRRQAHTFWHEVTHAILYDMGDKNYKNELFVEEFSRRLEQIIQTAKFNDPPK